MRIKELVISIDADSSIPLFTQIAEGMRDAIQTGRLLPGTALPGSRALAEHLNVSRTTVIAALAVLEETGWIEARDRSGFYVAQKTPTLDPKESHPSLLLKSRKGPTFFDLPTRQDLATSQMAKVTKLSEGLPDPRLLPSEELGKAVRRGLRSQDGILLEYGTPQGRSDLREALSRFLAEQRGHEVAPESILVTRGNRMGLNLLAQGLLSPGDLIAVEEPGNPIAWESFKDAKVRLAPIPVDSEGLVIEALELLLQRDRVRLLYLSPRFQLPTTVTLSPERRRRLLQLAHEHRFAIVEDDSETDYTFEGPTLEPMVMGEGIGTVIHLSSFSRLLAPGVRLGLLTGPQVVIDRLVKVRQRMDWQGDQALERAICELLVNGEIQRHIQRVRKEYHQRREAALKGLQQRFGQNLHIHIPNGGLSLWIRTDPALDLEGWCKRCANRGVLFLPGRTFTLDRRALSAFRLGYASFKPSELEEILDGMRSEFPE